MFSPLFSAGCINACNRNGICALEDGEYRCQCNTDWAGPDCSVRLETECNDEIDNDHGKYMSIYYCYYFSY